MDLSIIHKRSTRDLVFLVAFSWFFGGFLLADGIDRLIQDRLAYNWVGSLLTASAFLGVGILYTVMLLRRFPSDSMTPPEHLTASGLAEDHSETR
jgi:hypothetical protein